MEIIQKWNDTRFHLVLLIIAVFLLSEGRSFADSQYTSWSYEEENGCVLFDAEVYGMEDASLPIIRAALKQYDPDDDETFYEYIKDRIFSGDDTFSLSSEQSNDERITARTYSSLNDYDIDEMGNQEPSYYYFRDGSFGAVRYFYYDYTSVMDLFKQYNGLCYIPDRLTCGTLPMLSPEDAAAEIDQVAQTFGCSIEETPYILRAYSMDGNRLSQKGVHSYDQLAVNGTDLTAANWEIISQNGSDCYFVAYRFTFYGVPVTYDTVYIESQDYFTIYSSVSGAYNDGGMMYFAAQNQMSAVETFDAQTILSSSAAADVIANDLNGLLGVGQFVCKEISLEYLPLGYEGCDLETQAELTPAWIFYFDNGVAPMMVNALTGKIIR